MVNDNIPLVASIAKGAVKRLWSNSGHEALAQVNESGCLASKIDYGPCNMGF